MPTKTVPFNVDASYYSVGHDGLPSAEPAPTRIARTLTFDNTVTHDGPVRNYRYYLSRGYDATTNLSGTRFTIDKKNGVILNRHFRPFNGTQLLYSRTGDLVDPSVPATVSGLSETSANNAAISEFISKARSAQTALYSGVVLGELREALHMIRNPAQSLRRGIGDYFTALRKRRKGTPKQKRRALSQTWLEYSFGWVPLINDIKGGARVLDELLYRNESKYIRGFAVEESGLSTGSSSYAVGTIRYDIDWSRVDSCLVVYRGVVNLETNGRASVQQLLGNPLKLENFVPTVWELIPYSFVVDYFTNIGDILSAASYASSNFRWRNRTVIKERREIRTATRPVFSPPTLGRVVREQRFSGGSSEAVKRTVNRTRSSGLLIPTLEFTVPGMTSLKWLNLAALARTHKSLIPF